MTDVLHGRAGKEGINKDTAMRYVLTAIASTAVLIIILIILFIAGNGVKLFTDVDPISFLFGTEWSPSDGLYGIVPMVVGTILVTIGAVAFAFPVGLLAAIYISEFASPRLRSILKPLCEVFAGIPSVVYGFFGLVVLVPFLSKIFGSHLLFGSSWLAASIVLGIMALPTIISVSEDAIRAVPNSYREASVSMGANRWETTAKVIVPAAIAGISAAVTLGIGRAIGETMAVMMVSGNAAIIPDPLWNIFSLVSTMTGTLALEMPESVVGDTHYNSLFMLALVLMIMVFAVNLIAKMITNRMKRKFYGQATESRFGKMSENSFMTKIQSNKSSIMKFTVYFLIFIVAWMILSLLMSGLTSLAVSAVIAVGAYGLMRFIGTLNPTDREDIAKCVLILDMAFVLLILAVIIGDILIKGIPSLSLDFITSSPSRGGRAGGIMPAIVGTLELLAGTAAIALPLGILTGIYLAEYAKDNRFNRIIRGAIDTLNGTPSVVFGLFGMSLFVIYFGWGYSMVAGWAALSMMIMPVIIRTTEEAMRAVPNELREASRAMGATKWQTTYKVVFPAAIGGTVTGAILSLGRAAGETAPIMFTAAVAYQPGLAKSIMDPVMALPYHLYYLTAEVPGTTGNQYATATVLLIIVLSLFVAASLVRSHYSKKVRW